MLKKRNGREDQLGSAWYTRPLEMYVMESWISFWSYQLTSIYKTAAKLRCRSRNKRRLEYLIKPIINTEIDIRYKHVIDPPWSTHSWTFRSWVKPTLRPPTDPAKSAPVTPRALGVRPTNQQPKRHGLGRLAIWLQLSESGLTIPHLTPQK